MKSRRYCILDCAFCFLLWGNGEKRHCQVFSFQDPDDSSRQHEQPKQQLLPHILMVVMDDLGSHDLGLHGTNIQTPFTDQLADEGIYLDNYYVLPYCSATRAALLSGRYPLHTGCHLVLEDTMTSGLPLDEITLAQRLRERYQYQTHAVGKWHIGHAHWNQTPTFRGFQTFYGYYHGHQDYWSHYKESAQWGPAYDMHWDGKEYCGADCSKLVDERGNYSTHVYTRRAVEIIEHEYTKDSVSQQSPLFLYLAYQAVHWPDQVPDHYRDLYANQTTWTEPRRTYAGMLTAADESLRNISQALQRAGLWNNTLIVYTTDNGGPTDICMVQGSSNHPRRGGKCTVYEGGTTGDAILSGPYLQKYLKQQANKSTTKGRRYPHLFHVVDWFQTLDSMAAQVEPFPRNHSHSTGNPLDSVNHWHCLIDGGGGGGDIQHDSSTCPPREEVYIGYAAYHDLPQRVRWYGPALRYKQWKVIQGSSGGPERADDDTPAPSQPNRGGDDHDVYQLYNLDLDPEEQYDVSEEFPDIVQQFRQKLKDYHQGFVPPTWDPDPRCPFPGVAQIDPFGPTWLPWCNGAHEIRIY